MVGIVKFFDGGLDVADPCLESEERKVKRKKKRKQGKKYIQSLLQTTFNII